MPIRAKSKKQLDKILDEVSSYERQQMSNAWNIMKTVVTDVQQKKPYIYWEDVEAVIKKLQHDYDDISDGMAAIILQQLEQKVWIP